MKKMKLRVESLAVESFRTGGDGRADGTVRGHGDDCTWFGSCLCNTNYYRCGTGMETIHSCTYTADERCVETAVETCGCDTSYEQCELSVRVLCVEPTWDGC